MHETPQDIADLQALLDDSYARAGAHLRETVPPDRRVDAARLVEEMQGVNVMAVATVTADGRPLIGPVDGLLYRGRLVFGSSAGSVKARHVAERPHVSASYLDGVDLDVVVHGRVVEVDPRAADLHAFLTEIYPDWDDWGHDDPPAPYWRIEPDFMVAASYTGMDQQGT